MTPALLQTGKSQFTNVPASGAPTYAQRMQGQALRDEYSETAGEAAALTRLAPNSSPMMGFGTGQAIRDTAFRAAGAQTMAHFGVRQQLAEGADRAAQIRNQQVQALAELALKGEMHRADQVLKERGLDLEQQRTDQQGAYQEGQLGLGHDELAQRTKAQQDEQVLADRRFNEEAKNDRQRIAIDEKELEQRGALQDKELTLNERRFNEEAKNDRQRIALEEKQIGQQDRRIALEEKQIGQQDRRITNEEKRLNQTQALQDRRDTAALARSYTPDSVTKYMETGDAKDLVARDRKGSKDIKAGAAMTIAEARGIDTSGFTDEDGKHTQVFADFVDTARQIRQENSNLTVEEAIDQAAEQRGIMGTPATGPLGFDLRRTRGQSDGKGKPPVAGAKWSKRAGGWIVQDPATGKWMVYE